jgi:hypothetical protein
MRRRRMKKLLLVAAAVVGFATPASAFYTECTVLKDIAIVNRPGGHSMPRWSPLEKGDKIAIMDTYQQWVFVLHWVDTQQEYGWLPRNVLANCQRQEGTP